MTKTKGKNNTTDLIELILKVNAKNDEFKDAWYPVIFLAIKYQHYKILELLLKYVGNMEGVTSNDASDIMMAAATNWSEGVKLLLLYGLDVNIKDNNGHTMLDYANGNGHSELAAFLKSAGGYATQKAAEFV